MSLVSPQFVRCIEEVETLKPQAVVDAVENADTRRCRGSNWAKSAKCTCKYMYLVGGDWGMPAHSVLLLYATGATTCR